MRSPSSRVRALQVLLVASAALFAFVAVPFVATPAFAQGSPQATPIDSLSAEELVGRLLLLAFPGAEPPLERLTEFEPAGFLFYPSNVPSTAAARATVLALQDATDVPLLFGIDQEGGPFTTYRVDQATIFPGNMALAAAGDAAVAERVARATGE